MRIRNVFAFFFVIHPTLSNDDIIFAYGPGLKTGLENYIFWSEIGSKSGETGGTAPPRI